MNPRLRPMVVTAAAAVLSVGLLLAAARWGWLGPDVGRGSGFCEQARDSWIRQPANTWSNVGFVAAGLAIAWAARRPEGRLTTYGWLTTVYAVVVVLLGPASMAMHATQSSLGGRLDMLSMYLVAGFAFSYAVLRLVRGGIATFAGVYAAAIVGCEVVENLGLRVPMVHTGGNFAFALLLVGAVAIEVVLMQRRESVRDNRWGYAAIGFLLLAFVIWNLAQEGTAFCLPTSLLQGHAAWHALDAVAAWCLHRYWLSERPLTQPLPAP